MERFGHIIQHIDLSAKAVAIEKKRIFTFIVDNCSDALKSLKTCGLNLETETISNASAIFANLTQLETGNHLNRNEILPLCVKLKELRLSIKLKQNPIEFAHALPNLAALTVEDEDYFTDSFQLILNLQSYPNLTSLSLTLPNLFSITNISELKNLK